MISITNQKVAGFSPQWTSFRGFSILFDNPGDSLTLTENRFDLTCDVEGNLFYKGLRDSLAALDLKLLTNTYLFCPLPPASYHVTVWDGGNVGNIAKVFPSQQPVLQDLLAGLPDTLMSPCEMTDTVAAFPLVAKRDYDIRFGFDSIQKWSDSVLVARLLPQTRPPQTLLRRLRKRASASTLIISRHTGSAHQKTTPRMSHWATSPIGKPHN